MSERPDKPSHASVTEEDFEGFPLAVLENLVEIIDDETPERDTVMETKAVYRKRLVSRLTSHQSYGHDTYEYVSREHTMVKPRGLRAMSYSQEGDCLESAGLTEVTCIELPDKRVLKVSVWRPPYCDDNCDGQMTLWIYAAGEFDTLQRSVATTLARRAYEDLMNQYAGIYRDKKASELPAAVFAAMGEVSTWAS